MSTILVIDDDAQILHLCQALLEREGYTVVAAETAEAGIAACRSQSVDLVLTDIIMPDKDGFETIGEVRSEFPDIQIVAMSGGGRLGPGDYLPLAMKLGAGDVLAKPFTREELLTTVASLLPAEDETAESATVKKHKDSNG